MHGGLRTCRNMLVCQAEFSSLQGSTDMTMLVKGLRANAVGADSDSCICLLQAEIAAEPRGYTATKHQREVGTGYFDVVSTVCSNGASSTLALVGSTEAAQF